MKQSIQHRRISSQSHHSEGSRCISFGMVPDRCTESRLFPCLCSQSAEARKHHLNYLTHMPSSDVCSRNITLRVVEDVEYTVPGTRTTLHMRFVPDRLLHRRRLRNYVLPMYDQVQAHFNATGIAGFRGKTTCLDEISQVRILERSIYPHD